MWLRPPLNVRLRDSDDRKRDLVFRAEGDQLLGRQIRTEVVDEPVVAPQRDSGHRGGK